MTGRARPAWRPGLPLLGLLAGWVALFGWSGMVSEPHLFLVPTLLVGVLMALAGSGLRVLQTSAYVVAGGQLLVGLLGLNVVLAARESLLAVVPTGASVHRVVFLVSNGAATLNSYAAPVEVNAQSTRAMLTACALLVLFSIDVLALGLCRPPLVALPLLVTLSVPVSILTESLALPVFAITALLFLRLLATEHLDRFGGWGAGTGSTRLPLSGPMLAVLWQVGLVAVVGSLLLAPLVPVTDLLHRDHQGSGSGIGSNSSFELTGVNPFVHLRRDLVTETHTPLVYAQTEAASTSYLQTTVLDEFTSDEWAPSPRNLPGSNSADGVFPDPPGLAPGIGGREDVWSLQFAPNFATTWLPLPYPIRSLEIPGPWRYDARTLDVAFVGGGSARATGQLEYTATAFTPAITAQLLNTAPKAPAKLRAAMTKVPKDLPDVITTRAQEVTRGATTDFEKAVALQDWFRQGGGFSYSLDQRAGSGMDLLASFVTNDRVGYCEQFAAAMAAMGRVLGIPSRVVVGFLDGTGKSGDGRVLYTSDDRHAWPEMYFSGVGWVRFEPTPAARAGSTPEWTRQSAESAAPSSAPSATTSTSAVPRAVPTDSDTTATPDRGLSVPWWPVLALLVVLLLGLVPGVLRQVQRGRRLSSRDPAHLVEGAWAELRATALDLGLDWPEERSPREQARRVLDQVPAENDQVVSLQGLLVRVERSRYAPASASGSAQNDVGNAAGNDEGNAAEDVTGEHELTVATVRSWRRAMITSVDRARGWRGRVWPVSLLR